MSISPLKILIVEDDADDSFLLVRQLAPAQLDDHIILMDGGQRALEFLLQCKPPALAIFLDLKLPGMRGVQLLERVRSTPHLEAVPVLIMTGSTDRHDLERCQALGVTAYLPKPIKLATFIKTVAHLFPSPIFT